MSVTILVPSEMRDALAELARRRVGVTVQPRESWHVFDPRLIRWRLGGADRSEQLLSLSELRMGVEPVAAALAAERATPAQCGLLAGAVSDMVVHGTTGDLEAYLDADTVFHRTLLEASGNEMLRALGGVVAEVLAGRTHHHLMPSTPNPEAIGLARGGGPGGAGRRPHRGTRRDAADHRRGRRGDAGAAVGVSAFVRRRSRCRSRRGSGRGPARG